MSSHARRVYRTPELIAQGTVITVTRGTGPAASREAGGSFRATTGDVTIAETWDETT